MSNFMKGVIPKSFDTTWQLMNNKIQKMIDHPRPIPPAELNHLLPLFRFLTVALCDFHNFCYG